MDDTGWIIIQVITHTSLALLVLYITWLILRGLFTRDDSEREEHHD